jgi:hypothetical protein
LSCAYATLPPLSSPTATAAARVFKFIGLPPFGNATRSLAS